MCSLLCWKQHICKMNGSPPLRSTRMLLLQLNFFHRESLYSLVTLNWSRVLSGRSMLLPHLFAASYPLSWQNYSILWAGVHHSLIEFSFQKIYQSPTALIKGITYVIQLLPSYFLSTDWLFVRVRGLAVLTREVFPLVHTCASFRKGEILYAPGIREDCLISCWWADQMNDYCWCYKLAPGLCRWLHCTWLPVCHGAPTFPIQLTSHACQWSGLWQCAEGAHACSGFILFMPLCPVSRKKCCSCLLVQNYLPPAQMVWRN